MLIAHNKTIGDFLPLLFWGWGWGWGWGLGGWGWGRCGGGGGERYNTIVYTGMPPRKLEFVPVGEMSNNPALIYMHACNIDNHYNGVIMGAKASQITSLTIVYSIVYSDADQRKHQSSASLAFVRGIHRWPVNSPHKWPVTRKMFPFDDVIMNTHRFIWYVAYKDASRAGCFCFMLSCIWCICYVSIFYVSSKQFRMQRVKT